MDYRIKQVKGYDYLEILSASPPSLEASRLVELCWEHQTNRFLIHQAALGEDFFNLRTGAAGEILQKLANYSLKAAALVSPEIISQGRFGEMAMEANKTSRYIHFYTNQYDALEWLLAN